MGLKRRHSLQQKQENISRKQFETFLETHEFITGDISPDLGEDILVRIYDQGASTGLSFYVQLKSVDSIEKHYLKSGNISYPFEVKDLKHWEIQAATVILVVWDIKVGQGWWIWIGDAIKFIQETNPEWTRNKTVNIHLPSKNQINKNGLSDIRHLLANMYYPIVSKEKDLTINAKFSFPKTLEGKAKIEELKRHFASGDEVEFDGKYIETFDFPDWWKRLYGDFDPSNMYLKITPKRSKTPRPSQIEFISENERETISYVELWIAKQGEEEITLTNDQQNIPQKFTIVFNRALQQNQIKIYSNPVKLNSLEVLKMLKMQRILYDGGRLELTFLDTGELIKIPVPKKSFFAPDQNLIGFIEKVCLVQETFGEKIEFPEDGLYTKEDIQAADELAAIINEGIYKQSGLKFSIEIKKLGIEKIIERLIDGTPVYFQITSRESFIELLSKKIEVGPVLQKISGYWKMPLTEVEDWCKKASDQDALRVTLVDVELHEEFENWIKK